MRLCDLDGWPTALRRHSESGDAPVPPLDGRLKACWYIHGGDRDSDSLTLVVGLEDRDHFEVIRGYPEAKLRGIYAALRNHEGEELASLGDLEVVDKLDVWQLSF